MIVQASSAAQRAADFILGQKELDEASAHLEAADALLATGPTVI
jgi:hypothetical protein